MDGAPLQIEEQPARAGRIERAAYMEAKIRGAKSKKVVRSPLQRDLLERQAVQALRKMIIFAELAPGELLPEGEIGLQLGISRTPMREALKTLAAEGLVELRPHRRARVSALNAMEVEDLFEVMSELEGMAARKAANHIQPAVLERLEMLQNQMETHFRSGKLKEYFNVNQTIHRLVVEAAENSVLTATHDWLLGRAERARFLALQAPQRWNDSLREHRNILNCLKRGDGEEACRLTAQHVRRTGEIISKRIADSQGSATRGGRAVLPKEKPA